MELQEQERCKVCGNGLRDKSKIAGDQSFAVILLHVMSSSHILCFTEQKLRLFRLQAGLREGRFFGAAAIISYLGRKIILMVGGTCNASEKYHDSGDNVKCRQESSVRGSLPDSSSGRLPVRPL